MFLNPDHVVKVEPSGVSGEGSIITCSFGDDVTVDHDLQSCQGRWCMTRKCPPILSPDSAPSSHQQRVQPGTPNGKHRFAGQSSRTSVNQLFGDATNNDGPPGGVSPDGVPTLDGSPTGVHLADGTLWPDPTYVVEASWWLRYGSAIGGGELSRTQKFGVSSALDALITLATHPCGVAMLRRYRAHVVSMRRGHAASEDAPEVDPADAAFLAGWTAGQLDAGEGDAAWLDTWTRLGRPEGPEWVDAAAEWQRSEDAQRAALDMDLALDAQCLGCGYGARHTGHCRRTDFEAVGGAAWVDGGCAGPCPGLVPRKADSEVQDG